MARPQRLSEAQIAELFDPPTEQRDLVRHFTLSEADLGAIRRCRGDHNRLGYALMRLLSAPPRPSAAAPASDRLRPCSHSSLSRSGSSGRRSTGISRRNGTASVMPSNARSKLGLRPFGKRAAAELARRFCRKPLRTTNWPIWRLDGGVPAAPDRLSIADRTRTALRRTPPPGPPGSVSPVDQWSHRRAATQARCADKRREETGQNWLTWLRQMPEAAKPSAMLGLIERLEHVRAIGIEPGRGH